MNRIARSEGIPVWMERWIPYLEWAVGRYGMLSQEHRIWFWIATVVALLLVVSVTGYLIYRIIRRLNSLLQSPDGWRPVRFACWMWVGSGIWLLFLARDLQMEGVSGWSVAFACGILAILSFIWFMLRRLRFLRGVGATLVNGGIGLIVAPVVIQSFVLLLLLIVGCIALWIQAAFNTRRVYVEYRQMEEKGGLDTWEKIVAFTGDEWFPLRLSFGKFKGRL